MRRGAIAEVEHDLIHVTPSPAFGWVIAFDDRVVRLLKVLGGVAVRLVVAERGFYPLARARPRSPMCKTPFASPRLARNGMPFARARG